MLRFLPCLMSNAGNTIYVEWLRERCFDRILSWNGSRDGLDIKDGLEQNSLWPAAWLSVLATAWCGKGELLPALELFEQSRSLLYPKGKHFRRCPLSPLLRQP